ncbi:MAG: MBL fold metallo-hydrolase [Cytophagales bacterium]|nr:MBL fold metallo-hydrolase [Cytophagales bacterium]
MKIKFYGTRGSIPIADRDFLEFGGNTTSMKITRDDGRVSILDAGSGIRKLGMDLIETGWKQPELFIGFSHFHWDHLQGFPFFDPAYNKDQVINILAMGKERQLDNLEDIFRGQMRSEYFPVPFEGMGAKFNFLKLDENEIELNGMTIKVIKQKHPGGSYGYRLEDNNKCVVICTDLEHGDDVSPGIVDFCQGADLLIHEAQYTHSELAHHKGWGHSSYEQAMEVAERAGVGQLAMTHHDPGHNDEFLGKIEKQCQQRFPNCQLAREGVEIIV